MPGPQELPGPGGGQIQERVKPLKVIQKNGQDFPLRSYHWTFFQKAGLPNLPLFLTLYVKGMEKKLKGDETETALHFDESQIAQALAEETEVPNTVQKYLDFHDRVFGRLFDIEFAE